MDNTMTLTSRTPEIDAMLTRPVDTAVLDAVEAAIDACDPGAALAPVGAFLRALRGFASAAGREAAQLPEGGLLGAVGERARDLVALVWDLEDSYRTLCASNAAAAPSWLDLVAHDVAFVIAGHSAMVAAWQN